MPGRRRNGREGGAERPAILVLDDEEDMLYLTKEWLAHAFEACEVVGTRSWTEALALVEARTFDVVVSDHRMPGMDGLTFLTRIAGVVPPERCILMTAYLDKGLQERTRVAGMDFIEKSGDPSNVVGAVKRVLARPATEAASQPM